MTFLSVSDMVLGVVLAFSAVYFWERNYRNRYFFLIVLSALFNYLYSFFRVLESVNLIPADWYLSIGSFPVVKYCIITLSMLFLILGLVKISDEKQRKNATGK